MEEVSLRVSSTRHSWAVGLGGLLGRRREQVCVVLLLCALFLVYNYTNLYGSNWFAHPDDAGNWLAGKRYFESGSLVGTDELREEFEYPVFTPPSHVVVEGTVVPVKAPGIHIFTALGHLFGEQGVFWLIPLFSVGGLLFLYLLAKTLFDARAGFFTVLLFGASFPVVYWSNMLYANMPALCFFFAGMYYLARIIKSQGSRFANYALASVFFGVAAWLRYECLLFVFLALVPVVVASRHRLRALLRLRYLALSLVLFLIVVGPILSLHSSMYGSPFAIGYVAEDTAAADSSAGAGDSPVNDLVTGAGNIVRRFMVHDLHPDFGRLFKNAADWLLLIYPVPFVLGVIGIIWTLKKRGPKGSRILCLSFLPVLLFWTYDTLGGFHWGEGSSWGGSAYTRYLLIPYAILGLYAGGFLSYLLSRLRAWQKPHAIRWACVCLLVLQLAVLTPLLLFAGSFSLHGTTQQKQDFHALDGFVRQLPENSVVVSGFYSKAIVSRRVLDPMYIPAEQDRLQVTAEYIDRLLVLGYEVYIVEAAWHPSTYLDIPSYIETNCDTLTVRELEESKKAGLYNGDIAHQVWRI